MGGGEGGRGGERRGGSGGVQHSTRSCSVQDGVQGEGQVSRAARVPSQQRTSESSTASASSKKNAKKIIRFGWGGQPGTGGGGYLEGLQTADGVQSALFWV